MASEKSWALLYRKARRILLGIPVPRDRHLKMNEAQVEKFRDWGYFEPRWAGEPRILMAAGHGYGNVGDEAQCGACIARWRAVLPSCRITLFSPNPAYTEALHGERSEWAPRVAWFRANTIGPYFEFNSKFVWFFRWLKLRMTLSAFMMKHGLPLLFCNTREARILHELQSHDLFHISGGGFLTGKTPGRLWENCLLMRICQILDVPYILTGHNIGVFQTEADKKIAKLGLRGAAYIGLRDHGLSEKEIADIGISGPHVQSTCDDALFCERLTGELVLKYLVDCGGSSEKPWVAVNFHHWGQSAEESEGIENRFAEVCDQIARKHGVQVALISMTPPDILPNANIHNKMNESSILVKYSPDYSVVRGVIADAKLVFTMKHHPIVFAQGEAVPIVSLALDDYYLHKNRGALDNTGHGEYLITTAQFLSEEIFVIIAKAFLNREDIIKATKIWRNKMKQLEYGPYRKAISLIKTGHLNFDSEENCTHGI